MDRDQARAAFADALAQIAPECDLSAVDPSGDLREQLDLDSMDFLSLVALLEERHGVRLPEDDYPAFDTLDGALDLLVARSAAASSA
jgi:acyl carrier protein